MWISSYNPCLRKQPKLCDTQSVQGRINSTSKRPWKTQLSPVTAISCTMLPTAVACLGKSGTSFLPPASASLCCKILRPQWGSWAEFDRSNCQSKILTKLPSCHPPVSLELPLSSQ